MSKLYILCIIKCIHCSFVFNWRCKSIVLILSLLPLLSSFFVSPSSLSPHPFHFSDAVSLRSLTSPLPDAVPGRLPSCLYFTSFLLFLPFLLLLRFYKYPALGESPHRRISCLSLFFPPPTSVSALARLITRLHTFLVPCLALESPWPGRAVRAGWKSLLLLWCQSTAKGQFDSWQPLLQNKNCRGYAHYAKPIIWVETWLLLGKVANVCFKNGTTSTLALRWNICLQPPLQIWSTSNPTYL